jgi:hypothetical protein
VRSIVTDAAPSPSLPRARGCGSDTASHRNPSQLDEAIHQSFRLLHVNIVVSGTMHDQQGGHSIGPVAGGLSGRHLTLSE